MNNNIENEFSQIREESKEGIEVARGTPYNSYADSFGFTRPGWKTAGSSVRGWRSLAGGGFEYGHGR
jgi:hypothetical protein